MSKDSTKAYLVFGVLAGLAGWAVSRSSKASMTAAPSAPRFAKGAHVRVDDGGTPFTGSIASVQRLGDGQNYYKIAPDDDIDAAPLAKAFSEAMLSPA